MMKGFCECRAINFEIAGEIEDFSHCHCSQCRRMHGAAFGTFAGVKLDGFQITTGEDRVTKYSSSKTHERLFCEVCGSNLGVTLTDEPDMIYLSMSAIDGDPPRPPAYHIFVGSKAPWFEITDDAPQHDEFAPD